MGTVPAVTMSLGSRLFLDTSYAVALVSPMDGHHARALELAVRIDREQIPLVTTKAVLLEIGNSLSRLRFRSTAIALLKALQEDADVEVVPLSEELYAEAWKIYRSHADKEWGLTDCLSFVVMRQRELRDALTTDRHFRQAGFKALLAD